MSDSLWPHGLQHARPPCPSPSPRACLNSCPLSQWCHSTILSSVVTFSSCLQSFPASGSFPMSWLFISGGQSIGASASASVLLMIIQDWFPIGLTGFISLQSKRLSRVFSNTIVQKHKFFGTHFLYGSTLTSIYDYWKTIALTRWTFVGKVMSLLFNMLSRLVIAFLPRSKRLLISWLQSPSTEILEPKKMNSLTVSIVSPSIFHEVMGPDAMIFIFWMFSFEPAFSLSSFTFIKKLFSSLLSAVRVVSSAYLRLLIFLLAIFIPACASSSLAFRMVYSAYNLNKQGENIEPWHTLFPIWNQSIVPCLVLTVASWPAHRFVRRQVRWSGIPISWIIFHSLLWSTQSKALNEADVYLEFSCFFYDPMDVGNLIFGSSAFSKSSLNIWKFLVHVLLKPSVENFEHYFASVWD